MHAKGGELSCEQVDGSVVSHVAMWSTGLDAREKALNQFGGTG
jgi:hypothetical protein